MSVIIPVRNGAADLRAQLNALTAQEWPEGSEVIVVDNGSTDGTSDVAASFEGKLPRLRIVDASEEVGIAVGRNRGIEEARGDALLFLDADDEAAPAYVATMAAALEEHPFVAARLDCTSLNPPWAVVARPPFQEGSLGLPWGMFPVGTGGSVGVRRHVVEEHGGFDPDVPIGDDVDFCWRLQHAGVPLTFVPDAILRYRYRDTLRGIFRQARGYGVVGPVLYRQYHAIGMPKRPLGTVIRFWGQAVSQLAHIRTKGDRARITFVLGFRLGMLEGCWRARVVYL